MTSPSSSAEAHEPISNDVSLLPVMRALVECYTQVERTAARGIEAMGLTHAQFDVLATLGDTAGMTFKALGDATLITKGTLSPVLDRLEAKGLLQRIKGEHDRRQTTVCLTPEGQALYENTFMKHVRAMRPRFDVLDESEQKQLVQLLYKLKGGFA